MKGTVLNDRYILNDIIGVGGMAYVYDATDKILQRNVAIKILKDQFLEEDDFLKKFRREATSAASLTDDNIVGVYDVGTYKLDDKFIEYIVMEKIDGTTLKEVIEKEAPLTNERIVYYGKQIASALQQAHQKGIVHRDIKPANILITKEDDKVKVADFGIASISSDATITYTSSILGTVHYISPEQAKSQRIDSRSDLYSLGVVLYEMATGQVPFDGDTPVSIAIKHLEEEPKLASDVNPNISQNLALIIDKLLEKDPNKRYQSAFSLIEDLESYDSLHLKPKKKSKKDTAVITGPSVQYSSAKGDDKKSDKKKEGKGKKFAKFLGITAIAVLLIFMLYYFLNDYTSQVEKQNYVDVPNLIDMSEENALDTLSDLGLVGTIKKRVNDPTIKANNVVDQSVDPKTEVKKGTTVELVISLGKETVRVPKLVGFDISNVEEMLKERELEIGNRDAENNPAPENIIIKQDPEEGEYVEKGTKINIVLSLGQAEELTTVPALIGQDQYSAIQLLDKFDLEVGKIDQDYDDERAKNIVIDQSIASGSKVEKDSKVDIVISLGPKPSIKPPEYDNPVEPGEPTVPNGEGQEEPKMKNYVFNIKVPSGEADTFSVQIYNLYPNEELVYNKKHKKSEAVDGVLEIKIQALDNAKFEIFLDGEKAELEYE